MDLDLDAPGLTMLPCLAAAPGGQEAIYPDQGIWDFLSAATSAMAGGDGGQVPDVTQVFYETALAFHWGGSIHLAPAWPYRLERSRPFQSRGARGRPESLFQRLLETWKDDRVVGADIFRYIRRLIEEARLPISKLRAAERSRRMDYLLVDLRTGMTELADTAVGTLFDELVLVSGLNTQNLEGTLHALELFSRRLAGNEGSQVRIYPVFSPVPRAELEAERARLVLAHQRLTALDRRLRRQKSRLQLVLPPFDKERQKAPEFQVVHYCDYLGVGDGVILEEYPETHAAHQITEIARWLTRSLEQPPESVVVGEEQGSPGEAPEAPQIPPFPCWDWAADYWQDPPSWRWPLELLGEMPDPELLLDALPEGMDHDAGHRLLCGLAASLALERKEKLRVLGQLKTLEDNKLAQLLKVFAEERARWAGQDRSHHRSVSGHILRRMADWWEVLQTRGARLPAGHALVQRASEISRGPLPQWAWLLLVAHLSDRTAPDGWEQHLQQALGCCQQLRASVVLLPELLGAPAVQRACARHLAANPRDQPALFLGGSWHLDADHGNGFVNRMGVYGCGGGEPSLICSHDKFTWFADGKYVEDIIPGQGYTFLVTSVGLLALGICRDWFFDAQVDRGSLCKKQLAEAVPDIAVIPGMTTKIQKLLASLRSFFRRERTAVIHANACGQVRRLAGLGCCAHHPSNDLRSFVAAPRRYHRLEALHGSASMDEAGMGYVHAPCKDRSGDNTVVAGVRFSA